MLVLVVALLCCQTETRAQSNLSEGDMIVHLGAGLGAFGLIGYKTFPLLNVTGEYIMLDDVAGLGPLGVGAAVGLKRYQWELLDDWSTTRLLIAPRGVVHFDLGIDNLDFYAGAQVAISLWVDSSSNELFDGGPSGLRMNPGVIGGANFHLTDNIGFFGELGYGLGILNVGLMIKL